MGLAQNRQYIAARFCASLARMGSHVASMTALASASWRRRQGSLVMVQSAPFLSTHGGQVGKLSRYPARMF
ncbi:hypothetical protein OZ13_15480 [Xanthomonas cannabis pv. cannabis]|nr:hypothetical protein OZ13_15480 [Xanthomonas cannabis pv. cannabis]